MTRRRANRPSRADIGALLALALMLCGLLAMGYLIFLEVGG